MPCCTTTVAATARCNNALQLAAPRSAGTSTVTPAYSASSHKRMQESRGFGKQDAAPGRPAIPVAGWQAQFSGEAAADSPKVQDKDDAQYPEFRTKRVKVYFQRKPKRLRVTSGRPGVTTSRIFLRSNRSSSASTPLRSFRFISPSCKGTTDRKVMVFSASIGNS